MRRLTGGAASRLVSGPAIDATAEPGRGATIWLRGAPSETTPLARAVADGLRRAGRLSEILDGRELAKALAAETPCSYQNWESGLHRTGLMASVLARSGITVLLATDDPARGCRAAIRQRHAAEGSPFLEVHVTRSPRTDCEADLSLCVTASSVEECAERLLRSLLEREVPALR
ncbi:adenylyl-sulfate kinase [Streptomyces eurythermus]|uniref:adenylyl-sulfate kinase n=1 Tax=Streptomyces eurythermus TaxID=42237 RepID=UPI0036F779D0